MDSLLPELITIRDGLPALAKAVLEKVAFQCQLANGLEHLVLLFLQVSLLSADFLLGLALVENAAGVLDELLL